MALPLEQKRSPQNEHEDMSSTAGQKQSRTATSHSVASKPLDGDTPDSTTSPAQQTHSSVTAPPSAAQTPTKRDKPEDTLAVTAVCDSSDSIPSTHASSPQAAQPHKEVAGITPLDHHIKSGPPSISSVEAPTSSDGAAGIMSSPSGDPAHAVSVSPAEEPQSPGKAAYTSSSNPAIDQSPLDRIIAGLENLCRDPAAWHLSGPGRAAPDLNLSALAKNLDLAAMEPMLAMFEGKNKKSQKSQILNRERLLVWFVSVDVLPIIKQWMAKCYDDDNMELELNYVFHSAEDPHHTPNVQLLASCALHLPDIQAGRVKFDHEQRSTVIACAVFVRRLARGMMAYVMHYLDECIFPDAELFCYEWSAGTLTTAYTDIDKTSGGFFSVFLNSDLSKVMTPEVRALWEERLGVAGKISDPERQTPSIQVQRAAMVFAHTAQQKLSQIAETDYSSLKITDSIFVMSDRFTNLQWTLIDEVNSFPELLTAQSDQAPLSILPANLPDKIELHKTLCKTQHQPKSHKRKRNQTDTSIDKNFYTSNGRILPARKTTAASRDAEPFTQQEELVLYKRYKVVMLQSEADEGTEGTEGQSVAEKWWTQWLAIAYVLPGRGVWDCIAFYKENKESFQM
jgi:hypothetical protein